MLGQRGEQVAQGVQVLRPSHRKAALDNTLVEEEKPYIANVFPRACQAEDEDEQFHEDMPSHLKAALDNTLVEEEKPYIASVVPRACGAPPAWSVYDFEGLAVAFQDQAQRLESQCHEVCNSSDPDVSAGSLSSLDQDVSV